MAVEITVAEWIQLIVMIAGVLGSVGVILYLMNKYSPKVKKGNEN